MEGAEQCNGIERVQRSLSVEKLKLWRENLSRSENNWKKEVCTRILKFASYGETVEFLHVFRLNCSPRGLSSILWDLLLRAVHVAHAPVRHGRCATVRPMCRFTVVWCPLRRQVLSNSIYRFYRYFRLCVYYCNVVQSTNKQLRL